MYNCSIYKHRNPLYLVDGQHGWSPSSLWCNLQRGCWLWQVFMIFSNWEILNYGAKILIDKIWLFVQGLLTMATRPTRSERTASQFWRNITSESIIIRTIGLSTECKAVDQNINRKITNNCPAGCLFLSTFFLIVQGAFLHRDANVNPWSQLSSWSEHSNRTGSWTQNIWLFCFG